MTADGAVCIPNIGAAGIARRRRKGWVRLVVAMLASITLVALGVAPGWHFGLFLPYGAGLLGVLQAREQT